MQKLIPMAPPVLLAVAFVDFLIRCAIFAVSFDQVRYFNEVPSRDALYQQVILSLVESGANIVFFPLTWVVYAVIIHILIQINKRLGADA